MVATFAVMQSTSYYTRQSALSYYANEETTGVWLRGHETLGIAAGDAVKPEDFDRLCAGLDAHGNMLVKSSTIGPRMLGVDVTCSAPKAISVEFAFGNPKKRAVLAECEHEANEALISLVEREIALARRGHGGVRKERAKFVAAVFTHSETRPEAHADGTIMPDPQRHHHICFPNIAQRADGSWGGIDSVGLRSWRNALGAIWRLELSSALQRRGYQIERDTEDDWKWSLAGIPKELCDLFSARRTSLEELLAQAGTTSTVAPALAAAINATERRQKLDLSLDELTQKWRQAAGAFGFEPDAVAAEIREVEVDLEEAGADLEIERAARIAPIPAVLTEHSATFSRRDLIAKTANALVGTHARLGEALATTDMMIATESVIELGETRDGKVYSTPEMVAAERALTELVIRATTTRVAGPDKAVVDQLLADGHLNAEQEKVVRAATGGTGLTLVQGGAGTGKSTTLNAVSSAWQAKGYTVLGAAIAWRAANTLATDLGIEARAIDAWLTSVEYGNEPFNGKTCLIVEVGGLQATRQALRLLQAVEQAGAVTIIVGDVHQLQPVGAGHAMRLIRETVGAVRIETVVRQNEAWARQVPGIFARGEARQALDAFVTRDQFHIHDGPRATIVAVAERWQQIRDTSPQNHTLVVAKTNAEVRALSAAIRNRLREHGAIIGPDASLEAADASGNRHTLRLATGDRIRFLRRNDELRVVNGTEARILEISTGPDGTPAITAEKDGERFTFSPADIADAKGRARLSHAYASTIFQSQGMTVDHALVLVSDRFDRHDAYVGSSRAREKTEFFLDGTTLDKELEQSGLPAAEADRAEARLAHLAERLSRRSLKTNALDIIAEKERVAVHRREFEHEL
ncbi:MobF family relaxase [Pelagibacterium lacus]|uniref:TrwC relaxase domain-containing protein n=1 Tax=Pelagibacterium lacus TaxID=2282655 RepID=A0A369W1P5_9HYPH|nr:MobF family relaxase [Pelagibacterium lacus]RDE07805.1 hypothetical protein DVH29_14850 [Pelagibacterium lacus]